ncbi:MotA/TolQ/ExbB proton channel family protein [Segatella bryantii]|uniref:MotA/TolQ/ExbB proton channel family protein n=1 Tax=Segatella bryantii TaxID=77095 RepID=UPI00285323DD|nr:MotA/TolQ/ExbB proton channel family protein [Segatella bryantii]MDR4931723.1 MotA/TolQ/ExbB proton channel family protein [Segatella bryantii]
MTNFITWVSLVIIIGLFAYFGKELYKLYKANNLIKNLLGNKDLLSSFVGSKLEQLCEAYRKTINIKTHNGEKSNIPSSSFFNDIAISTVHKVNLRMLDTASGTLVGLGLLGTFLGLTLGVKGIDLSTSENIQDGIQNLLGGMGTAFLTSLAGMGCSLVYTSIDKKLRNILNRNLTTLTESLDEKYYIDDIELQNLNQKQLMNTLYNSLKSDMEQLSRSLITEITAKLSYSNENGENITVANAIREILSENAEQSKALKSFSTDLALELNNGFDEVLSRQMQQKILPLMESVDNTTKSLIEHIDQMASTVASPASGMMESVVEELKKSMRSIVDEFKTNLSGSTTSQLETLALQLGSASQTMCDFPKNMENISNTLQVTIDEVKNAIAEISKTSATANSTAMQQMQEQIALATGSFSNAITEVKEVMSGLTQSSQEQSNQMAAKLADATEKMGTFLDNTIVSLSSSVQNSMKSITDDVSSKQTDLIALQEDTTTQTKKLLEAFNTGLDRLEKMNEYIAGTMNGFRQAQGEISVSTGNLRTISGDMKLATELFNKGQNDYTEKLSQLQLSSQRGIEKVEELLVNSGQMSDEYAQKFEIIKQGLTGIFSQLQTGLTEYSRTVQATTEKYLDQYSSSLTQTTDALASTILQQNEVVEMLNETLSKNRH